MLPSHIVKHRGKVDMSTPNAFPLKLFITCWLHVDASFGECPVMCWHWRAAVAPSSQTRAVLTCNTLVV